jgi:hypothetical protein
MSAVAEVFPNDRGGSKGMDHRTALAKLRRDLQAIEAGPPPTAAEIFAELRLLERAERRLDHPRKPRPSRRKPRFRLADIVAELLRDPRFAAAPMSAATICEIQARSPQRVTRAAIIKSIQRRWTNAALPQMSNDAARPTRHVCPRRGSDGHT